jgi:hypothetical protein
MADDLNNENALPPKLNLRAKVSTPLTPKPLVPPTAEKESVADAPVAPTPPAPPTPPAADADTPEQGSTMRIKIPAKPGTPSATTKPPATDSAATPPAAEASSTDKPEPVAEEKASTPAPRPQIRPTMAPKTIKLKKPVPLGIKRDTPDPAAAPGSKRATSKISLPTVPDAADGADAGKPKPIQISKPADEQAITDAATPAKPAPDPKRQTSRISLESAFGSDSDSDSGGPKTIKLKRPGSSTVKVQGMAGAGSSDAPKEPAVAGSDASPDAEDDETPDTQKKTIKVKRPGARPALRTASSKKASVSIKKPSGGDQGGRDASGTMFAPPPAKAAPVDSAHWFFILTSCAALIITGVLIYVQCAQALGPDYSLTPLSYGAPNAELSWPGRLRR